MCGIYAREIFGAQEMRGAVESVSETETNNGTT